MYHLADVIDHTRDSSKGEGTSGTPSTAYELAGPSEEYENISDRL